MNSVENMRFLIEQTKIVQLKEKEIWEFVRLTPQQTGLPYNIYVDNGGAYIHHHHKLWLYVDIDSNKFPVTIERKPMLMSLIKNINFDYNELVDFIHLNQNLLKNLADGKTDDSIFFALLKRVDERKGTEKGLISEIATLRKEKSKLPTTIWLDDDKLYKPHAPRIKFRAVFQNKITKNDPSMEVENPEKIHNLPVKHDLTTTQINHIKKFVTVNKNIILDLANKVIDYAKFLKAMKIVDEEGNIISKKDEITIGKYVNGFAKCEKNGKYDHIDENGKLLFGDFRFEEAGDFVPYDNNMLLAYVSIGNESFYINHNGNRVHLI